jgi:hypothetical protein
MIVVLAALAMLAQDMISVLLVQAEARNRAHLAGICDAIGWGLAIATTTISVTALQGHSLGLKIAVVLAVSASNYIGTLLGVRIGKRWVKGGA